MYNFEKIKSLYLASDYSKILNEFNQVIIPYSIDWKNIGVSLSGGADSALLAVLLSNLIIENRSKTTIHIITNVRCWKTRPWQQRNSMDVFEWLIKAFPSIEFKRHENFIAPDLEWGSTGPNIKDEHGNLKSGNQIELRAHAEYVAHTEKLDAWYCAVTKNPDEKFNYRLIERDFDIENLSHLDLQKLIKPHMGGLACHPFIYVQKDWIVSQYKKLGIMDLFNLTRSCEGDSEIYPEIFGDLDYKTYKPGSPVPVCGKCFWCQEREWGINKCQD